MRPDAPSELSPDQRSHEVARILAAGARRLLARPTACAQSELVPPREMPMPAPASTSKIDSEHLGIGTALLRHRLTVPLNQREYSWEEKHVLDLLHDFTKAISAGKASYFLGSVVLTTSKSGGLEVADGQQRLATTTILLAAIRHYYFFERKEDLLVQSLDRFLFDIDREAQEIVPRLTLNIDDNEFFRKRVLSQPGSPERTVPASKQSHRRIEQAASLTAAHLHDVLKPHGEGNHTRHLNLWAKFIEHQAQVIALRVPDDLNAYVMFETLNDRGLRTSQSDLLKNYLFGESDNRIAEAQQKWAETSGTLEGLGVDDIILTYLRHFTISTYGPTREREVFERVREVVSGSGQAIRFLDQLAASANDYVAILTPTHAKWNAYQPSVRDHLSVMLTLKATPIRPLMLSVARKFSPRESEKALRMFVCWSVRVLISGGGRSGLMEEAYAERAKAVTEGTIKTADQLATSMSSVLPKDAQFEEAFATARVSQNALARYYLRALELQLKGDKEPELVPNESVAINLEHILPENPGPNWPDIDPETASAYWRRLGNMVLLQATKNSMIGNSSFAEKRVVLQNSAYVLTSYYLGRQEAPTSPERQRRDPVAGAPGLGGSFVPR